MTAPQLPNTDVELCEHPEHDDSGDARATSLIRFAKEGVLFQFHSCLQHASAAQFGYIKPPTDAETLAARMRSPAPAEQAAREGEAREAQAEVVATELDPAGDPLVLGPIGEPREGSPRLRRDDPGREIADDVGREIAEADATAEVVAEDEREERRVDEEYDRQQAAEEVE